MRRPAALLALAGAVTLAGGMAQGAVAVQLGATGAAADLGLGPWAVTTGGIVTDGTEGALESTSFRMTTAVGSFAALQPDPVGAVAFALEVGPHDILQHGLLAGPLPLIYGADPPVLVTGETVVLHGLNLDGAAVSIGATIAPSAGLPPPGGAAFLVPGGLAPGYHDIGATTSSGTSLLAKGGLSLPALVVADLPDVGGTWGLDILAAPGTWAAFHVGPPGAPMAALLGVAMVGQLQGTTWGFASLDGVLPDDPSLSGLEVHAVAVVLDPQTNAFQLTNELTIVIGG